MLVVDVEIVVQIQNSAVRLSAVNVSSGIKSYKLFGALVVLLLATLGLVLLVFVFTPILLVSSKFRAIFSKPKTR